MSDRGRFERPKGMSLERPATDEIRGLTDGARALFPGGRRRDDDGDERTGGGGDGGGAGERRHAARLPGLRLSRSGFGTGRRDRKMSTTPCGVASRAVSMQAEPACTWAEGQRPRLGPASVDGLWSFGAVGHKPETFVVFPLKCRLRRHGTTHILAVVSSSGWSAGRRVRGGTGAGERSAAASSGRYPRTSLARSSCRRAPAPMPAPQGVAKRRREHR